MAFGRLSHRHAPPSPQQQWEARRQSNRNHLSGVLKSMFPQGPVSQLVPDPVQQHVEKLWTSGPNSVMQYYVSLPVESYEREAAAAQLRLEVAFMDANKYEPFLRAIESDHGFSGELMRGLVFGQMARAKLGAEPTETAAAEELARTAMDHHRRAFEMSHGRDANALALAQHCFYVLGDEGIAEFVESWRALSPWNRSGWTSLVAQLRRGFFGTETALFDAATHITDEAPPGDYIFIRVPQAIDFLYKETCADVPELAETARRDVYLREDIQQLLDRAWHRWLSGAHLRQYLQRDRQVASQFFHAFGLSNMPTQAFHAMQLSGGYAPQHIHGHYLDDPQASWTEFALFATAVNQNINPVVGPHFYMENGQLRPASTLPSYSDAIRLGMIAPPQ